MAEELQTPIFLVSDLELGMNEWVTDEFEYPTQPLKRGKVLHQEDLNRVDTFRRYFAGEGDYGIPSRTLPGTDHPLASYFTRGSGHDENAKYTEDPQTYKTNMLRLKKKFDCSVQILPKPVLENASKSKFGVIAYGTSHDAVREAIEILSHENIHLKYLRLLSFPFHHEVKDFISSSEQVFVVEQNRDGQMKDLLHLGVPGSESKLKSIAHSTGWPLDADYVVNQLRELMHNGS